MAQVSLLLKPYHCSG